MKPFWSVLILSVQHVFAGPTSFGGPVAVATYSVPLSNSAHSSLPLFYGWFYNDSTAESMSIIGKKYFLSGYDKIPSFQNFVNDQMTKTNITNPLEYYVKPVDPDSGLSDMKYHTTAKFCGRNDSSEAGQECISYLNEVGSFIGRPFRMHFVGLFFTRETYGLRLKLTAQEQKLFSEDTRENSAQQSENDVEPQKTFPYEPYFQTKLEKTAHSPFYPGIKFKPQKQNFHPTESRAHVTLGCAPGVAAVQTGVDLLEIIDLEVSTFVQHKDFVIGGNSIPKGVMREYLVENEGNMVPEAFVIYPEEEMIVDGIFDAYL